MTAIQPEQVRHGICPHCGRRLPLFTDGTVITHYSRSRQAGRSRRKHCAGSRRRPRQEQP